jgi:hypothetical protein
MSAGLFGRARDKRSSNRSPAMLELARNPGLNLFAGICKKPRSARQSAGRPGCRRSGRQSAARASGECPGSRRGGDKLRAGNGVPWWPQLTRWPMPRLLLAPGLKCSPSLPCGEVLRALEAGHWQSCLLRLARLPQTGAATFPWPDWQLV